jgi:hypothetical protein
MCPDVLWGGGGGEPLVRMWMNQIGSFPSGHQQWKFKKLFISRIGSCYGVSKNAGCMLRTLLIFERSTIARRRTWSGGWVVGTRLGGPSLTRLVWRTTTTDDGCSWRPYGIWLNPAYYSFRSQHVPFKFPMGSHHSFLICSLCSQCVPQGVFPIALGSKRTWGRLGQIRGLSGFLAHSQW